MANQDYTSTRTPPFVPQDPNIFRNLRFGNIFSEPEESSTEVSSEIPVAPFGTPANDRLNELLANYPETQAPGIMKKIILSMIGGSDPRLASDLMNQPSGEQQDWLDQIELAKVAAEMERQMSGQELERGRLGLSHERLAFDIDKFEQESTPEQKHAMEIEKIDLRGENVIEQIEQRAEAARETNRLKLANTLDVIAARARNASQLEGKRQAGRGILEEQRQVGRTTLEAQRQAGRIDKARKGESESDRARRINNNIREYLLQHPEDDMYLDRDREGNVKGVKPVGSDANSAWFTEKIVTQEKYDQILNAILAGGDESGQGLVPDSTPTGQIEVIDPDGNEGFIPINQLEEALKEGYTRVQQ